MKRLPARLLVAAGILVGGLASRPVVAADLDQGIQDLARSLSSSLASAQIKKIAVTEFTDLSGSVSLFGQLVAEDLITQLSLAAQPGQFDIVERRRLAQVLEEQNLSASSLVDQDTIARVGKLLGIDAIITGSLADLDTEVKVNARAISVETAKIFTAATTKIVKTQALDQMLRQAAQVSAPRGNAQAPRASTAPAPTLGSVLFENDFLVVEDARIGASAKSKYVSASLRLRNKTNQSLELAIQADGWGRCKVALVGDRGGDFEFQELKGLECSQPEVKREGSVFGNKDAGSTLPAASAVSPGATVNLNLRFHDRYQAGGSLFSVTVEMLRIEEGQVKRFNVGVSGLPAPQQASP